MLLQTIEQVSIALQETMENVVEGARMLRIMNERFPARNLLPEFNQVAQEQEEAREALEFEEWWRGLNPINFDWDSGIEDDIEEEHLPNTPPVTPER